MYCSEVEKYRLPTEVVESTSFEIFQSHPGQPALGGPARAGGLDKTTSRGPFQPQSFCEIMINSTQRNTTFTVHILNIKKADFQIIFQSN